MRSSSTVVSAWALILAISGTSGGRRWIRLTSSPKFCEACCIRGECEAMLIASRCTELESGARELGARRDDARSRLAHAAPPVDGARSSSSSASSASARAPRSLGAYSNTDIPFDCVPRVARRATVECALSNSFGFGGQNLSLLFRRIADPRKLDER